MINSYNFKNVDDQGIGREFEGIALEKDKSRVFLEALTYHMYQITSLALQKYTF